MHQSIAKILAENGVPFKLHLHSDCLQPISTRRDFAKVHGCCVLRMAKTLLLQSRRHKEQYCLAIAPTGKHVDMREIAGELGVSHLRLAPFDDVLRLLNYPAVAMSPLGCGDIPVFMDHGLLQYSTIFVGAGVVGEEIELAPTWITQLTGATVLSLDYEERARK